MTDIEGVTYDKVMTINVNSTGQLVIYNGNGNTGGSVPVDGNGYSEGAMVTVLGNTGSLTKSGFLFSEWNTAADGTGTSHAPGATLTIGASDVTLYARWTPVPPPEGVAVYTGANGNSSADTWNNSVNWNYGAGPVPGGSVNVEIASGKIPWTVNLTPAYTGNLTLRSNSTLGLGSISANNTTNALGTSTNASTITMEAGSKIIMRHGAAYTFNQNIALTGAAAIQLSESTSGHNAARTFASPIAGAHDFTLLGQNGNTASLNAANSFTSLTASVLGSNNWKVLANAAESLGTGDVTINNTVNLIINQQNAMNLSRALRLNGVRSTKITGENKLVLNSSLTVAEFWLDNVRMANGTYGSSSGLVDSGGSPLISGTGTLIVTDGAGPGPVDHFGIAPISSPQTVGTPITGITLTAQDASNQTATGFTGTVTFGGTAGVTGTSASFVAGVLSGVSVTPTVAGNNLTLTVNDGASHTGFATITTIQTQYAAWSGGAAFDADANNDGVANGVAWVLGAANPFASAMALLPSFDNTTDADYFIYTYRRRDAAHTDARTTIAVEYGSDLSGWTTAVHDGVNIIITPTDDGAGAGIDSVQVKIKRTFAVGGKLFGRLKVIISP